MRTRQRIKLMKLALENSVQDETGLMTKDEMHKFVPLMTYQELFFIAYEKNKKWLPVLILEGDPRRQFVNCVLCKGSRCNGYKSIVVHLLSKWHRTTVERDTSRFYHRKSNEYRKILSKKQSENASTVSAPVQADETQDVIIIDDDTPCALNAMAPKEQRRNFKRKAPAPTLPNLSKEKPQSKHSAAEQLEGEALGLLGVEYVIKMTSHPGYFKAKYFCGLCEVQANAKVMQAHLFGLNHRLKFCKKHFPTAMQQYEQYTSEVPDSEQYKALIPILDKLAVAIEKYHGTDTPFLHSWNKFNSDRNEALSKVCSRRHPSEQNGPTFAHVINSKEVDEMLANSEAYKPKVPPKIIFDKDISAKELAELEESPKPKYRPKPQIPIWQMPIQQPVPMPQRAPVNDEVHKLMVREFLRKNQSEGKDAPLDDRHDRRRPYPSDGPYGSHSYSTDYPPKRYRAGDDVPQTQDVWQKYSILIDQKIKELDRAYARYFEEPETHPSYEKEWQHFWQQGKERLKALGQDYRKHDFQPEWVQFFKKRLPQLYSADKNDIEVQCRQKLSLPILQNLPETKRKSPPVRLPPQAPSVHEPRPHDNPLPHKSASSKYADITARVIAALRLLTALEEHLGSLGSKTIDLLSQAVQVEKSDPKKIISFLSRENRRFLETAKEKLKSVLFAGFITGLKERAMQMAIQEVRDLLQVIKNVPLETQVGGLRTSANGLPSNSTRPNPSKPDSVDISSLNIDPSLLNKLFAIQQTVANQSSNFNRNPTMYQEHPNPPMPAPPVHMPIRPDDYPQQTNNFNVRHDARLNNSSMMYGGQQPYPRHVEMPPYNNGMVPMGTRGGPINPHDPRSMPPFSQDSRSMPRISHDPRSMPSRQTGHHQNYGRQNHQY